MGSFVEGICWLFILFGRLVLLLSGRSGGASAYHYHELASRLCLREVLEDFLQGAANAFLVNLAYLSADADLPLWSEDFDELRQSLHDTMWRLVEDHGSRFFCKGLKSCLPSFLLRQEPFEAESVARQAAAHQCRHEGCCSRKCDDFYASLYGFASHEEAWVADTWCACIADYGNRLSCKQTLHDALHRLVLVELVVREHGILDVEVPEQVAARARVLGKDEVSLAKHLECPHRDVLHVAYRSRYQVKRPHTLYYYSVCKDTKKP